MGHESGGISKGWFPVQVTREIESKIPQNQEYKRIRSTAMYRMRGQSEDAKTCIDLTRILNGRN